MRPDLILYGSGFPLAMFAGGSLDDSWVESDNDAFVRYESYA